MSHTHEPAEGTSAGRLLTTMLLNFAITVVEIVGGLLSGSLSLLSDALHNLSDGLSIVLTWGAIRLTKRRNSARHTYGLKRAEIVAAFINAAVLLAITLFLFQHAALRLGSIRPSRFSSACTFCARAYGC